MHFNLSPIVLAALLLSTSSTSAQDALSQLECKPASPSQPRPNASATQPKVDIHCGSNSIIQTFSTQTGSNESNLTAAKRKDDLSSGFSVWVALITGAAGVLGAFAGAIASYLVARAKSKSDLELETKRLSANVISTERLRWLQDIRQRLSTLFQQLDLQYNMLKRPVAPGLAPTTQLQLDEMSSEVMGQCNMITLMLNPAKPDQAALSNSLQGSLQFMHLVFQQASTGTRTFNDAQYSTYKQAAFDAMTRLGVDTWKQVKSLA